MRIANNKTAVITGATRGIGLATSKAFVQAGFRVIGICRNVDESIINSWNSIGCSIGDLHSVDISNSEACQSLFSDEFLSANTVDVLVNNAGITKDGFFHKMSFCDWKGVLDTNLVALYNVTHPVYKYMIKAQKNGVIVNVASINGQRGQAGQCNYSASKAGMHGFTMALAQEGARYGIRVNTVSPGYTDTKMTQKIRDDIRESLKSSVPLKRFATTEEIADAILFTASEKSSFITGAEIPVNGGMYIS